MYRERVFQIMAELLRPVAPVPRALDYGAGAGWYARAMQESGLATEVLPLEVHRRRDVLVEPVLYDGRELPFPDKAFDLVYAVDVLHHSDTPRESVEELCRCAARFVLLKDHTFRTAVDFAALGVLDELCNRPSGVRSPRRYQRDWEWLPWFEACGFRLHALVHPAPCHRGLQGRLLNRLQFVGLWGRAGERLA